MPSTLYVFFANENQSVNTKWNRVNGEVLKFRFLCIQFTNSQIMYCDKLFTNFADVEAEAMTTSSHSRNLSEASLTVHCTVYSSHYLSAPCDRLLLGINCYSTTYTCSLTAWRSIHVYPLKGKICL